MGKPKLNVASPTRYSKKDPKPLFIKQRHLLPVGSIQLGPQMRMSFEPLPPLPYRPPHLSLVAK